EPDWTPLTGEEVSAVLARYPGRAAGGLAGNGAVVAWSSPRPMSAAGLGRHGTDTVFGKRPHVRVPSTAPVAAEHAFAAHLRANGLPVPAVWRTTAGRSTVASGDFVYEVHDVAPGIDLYRDAMSWTPFASIGHAWAAGAALARLHRAAGGFGWPGPPPAGLPNSRAGITPADPPPGVGAGGPPRSRPRPHPAHPDQPPPPPPRASPPPR